MSYSLFYRYEGIIISYLMMAIVMSRHLKGILKMAAYELRIFDEEMCVALITTQLIISQEEILDIFIWKSNNIINFHELHNCINTK